jgi:predicted DNA-binding transcriptional regulator AlpA
MTATQAMPALGQQFQVRPIFVKLPEVSAITRLSRSSIYALAAKGNFPAPHKLAGPRGRASGWLLSEVEEWARSRVLGGHD